MWRTNNRLVKKTNDEAVRRTKRETIREMACKGLNSACLESQGAILGFFIDKIIQKC